MVLLLLCLTCVIPCVIIGVYSDTHVLPNGDVLYMGSQDPMTAEEADKHCFGLRVSPDKFYPFPKLLLDNEIDRDEIKNLTDKPVWTDFFRSKMNGLYRWRRGINVNLTVTPMDDSKEKCEAKCCRLVFDPPSGKVYPVSCNTSAKFITICQFYNRFEKDYEIGVVDKKVETEKKDRIIEDEMQSAANHYLRRLFDQINEDVTRLKSEILGNEADLKKSLKSTNDSINSLTQKMTDSKINFGAVVIISLLVNLIFGVLFYTLFKKVSTLVKS